VRRASLQEIPTCSVSDPDPYWEYGSGSRAVQKGEKVCDFKLKKGMDILLKPDGFNLSL